MVFYDHFLSSPYLEYAAQKVKEREELAQTDGEEALPYKRMRAWRSAMESNLTSMDALT